MKKLCVILLLITATLFVNAQEKFTISGFIKDSLSGETLIGANLGIKSATKSIITNGYGFYSITLPRGTYLVNASYIGYQSKETIIELNGNREMNLLFGKPKESTTWVMR